jgi:hypothetical protein
MLDNHDFVYAHVKNFRKNCTMQDVAIILKQYMEQGISGRFNDDE